MTQAFTLPPWRDCKKCFSGRKTSPFAPDQKQKYLENIFLPLK
jgi:hypothetical protein